MPLSFEYSFLVTTSSDRPATIVDRKESIKKDIYFGSDFAYASEHSHLSIFSMIILERACNKAVYRA